MATGTMTMSYQSIKTMSMAKDVDEKRRENREKAMILFAFQLLLDKGYVDTASSLAAECSLNLEQYSVCENIDLNSIFVEFEVYYNLRFQRYPQYFKKSTSPNGSAENLLTKLRGHCRKGGVGGGVKQQQQQTGAAASGANGSSSTCSTNSTKVTKSHKNPEAEGVSEAHFGVQGFGSASSSAPTAAGQGVNLPFCPSSVGDDKLLKPISCLDFSSDDLRMFADMIQKEIVVSNLRTKWEDVIGLESAKTILQESLIYTQEFQDFFGTSIPPWRGLLLYGPPGTGKTLLAKAVASECGTTFFNISSATVVSKWRGDSEKIVKVLFELARYHAPSTIFFDEFDALGSKRDTGESDACRRLKSEILQQMDGILAASSFMNQNHQQECPIFILAATNLPWDLDPAILRRMEKRIYVPLPNTEERRAMFHLHFSKTAESVAQSSRHGRNALMYQIDLDVLATATEGYSGSDLQQIVKETVVRKFRDNFANKIKKLVIRTDDVMSAIQSIPSTVKDHLCEKFDVWNSGHKAS